MSPPSSLSDELRPLADSMAKFAREMPVMRLTATLGGDDADASATTARQLVLEWIEAHGYSIPKEAWTQDSYESDLPGTPVSFLRLILDKGDYWIIRLDHPENAAPGPNPGRVWSNEISVVVHEGTATFALRQRVAGKAPIFGLAPAVPRVIRNLADNPGLIGRSSKFRSTAMRVRTEEEIEEMLDVLRAPTRRRPVFVVSETPDAQTLINPNRVAARTVGLAHVFRLGHEAGYILTTEVGKEFSVFNGAVRTYQPNLDFDSDSPSDHPIALPNAINQWAQGGGPSRFLDFLVFKAAEASLERGEAEREVPSFSTVKLLSVQRQREAGISKSTSDREKLELAELEINALKGERDDWERMAYDEEANAKLTVERATIAESRIFALNSRIVTLEERIREATKGDPDVALDVPKTFDRIREWADENLAGRLILTSRAARSAKNALFEDPSLAYRSLLLLSNEYRNMKIDGGEDRVQAFENKCRELGLENSRTGDETRLLEKGDEFVVLHKGQRQLLNFHLKNRGNTRDPKRCFRLYYFWDDEEQVAVVGSLPAHLSTRTS